MKRYGKAALVSLGTLLLVFALFRGLYLHDNKYTAGAPYGKDGVISFTEADLNRPIFLVDGWLLNVDDTPQRETFIGQYSNFSYVTGGSPFGKAVYRLTLQCEGVHALTLEIPEIFTRYTLYLNDAVIGENGSGAMASFVLTDRAELRLEVENRTHYYSGLTYPPALGTAQSVGNLLALRLALYTAMVVCALTLAVFSAVLWLSRAKDGMFLHFGLLCLAFALAAAHPLFRLTGWNGPLRYALEDSARLFMLLQAVEVGARLAGWSVRRWYRRLLRPVGLALCVGCFFAVSLIIPTFGTFIKPYGQFINFVSLLGWAVLCLCTVSCVRTGVVGHAFLSAGCCALGAGFLVNLLNNNRFEPVCTVWQTEWAGLLLVFLFGGLMARYNREILVKNRRLMAHMEELVQQRTGELGTMLEERKRFFDHMAHNLKAPITAVHGFISLIRESNLYLDGELREYIRLIEEETGEIGKRVQSLSALHEFDRVTAPREALDVDELLAAVYDQNAPEADAAGVHFSVDRLDRPAHILGQREKLLTLFENLIYNSLAFTPPDGSIRVTPSWEGGRVVMDVADTGCGIAPEHLPHIFEQFYSARNEKGAGSGLGLYIVQLTAQELGGWVEVQSQPGEGATFRLHLPVCAPPEETQE